MNFEFATAGRVLFGSGKRNELFSIAPGLGQRVLLVTGGTPARADWAPTGLAERGLAVEVFPIAREPTVAIAEAGRQLAKSQGIDLVVAVGGGSVIDGAKAIAALATNEGEIVSYLEVIGSGQPLRSKPLPLIVLPTTAGAGTEVTRNAVLLVPEHQIKVSLRSPLMLPAVAIIDPELTLELPPPLTAATGMDALTQVIEPFLSCRANPLVDGLCREVIPRIARALPRAFRNGNDLAARAEMSLGSLFGGLALANAGLGAVHGFAAPIGGMFDAPHGAVCAALLPEVMRVNLRALRARHPQGDGLPRFSEVARLLAGKLAAEPEEGIDRIRDLTRELGILPLGSFGVRVQHVPVLCQRAAQASSMKANPLVLTQDELAEILTCAL